MPSYILRYHIYMCYKYGTKTLCLDCPFFLPITHAGLTIRQVEKANLTVSIPHACACMSSPVGMPVGVHPSRTDPDGCLPVYT